MFQPKYTISAEVFGAACEIAEIKAIVERSRVLPLNEMQLKRQALIRMVHTSATIEGNSLEEFQVGNVLSGMSVVADERSIQEVRNLQKAIKEMERLTDKKTPLSLEIIFRLHSLIIEGLLESKKVGAIRPGFVIMVDVLGDGREIPRFQGPDPKKVKKLLTELLNWLKQAEKDGMHPIIKAGIFHSEFAHIHPFSDGNGRMARLLSNYILYLDGWDFRKVLVLEECFLMRFT